MFYGRKWRRREELDKAIHDYVEFYTNEESSLSSVE
ncbi:IS3 family transposase [Corynebacterium propinquum]|uniref:IS3 family transposase n=2 Tax=Corynebacteriaceae TaxID=1653 RepID=A0ABT7G2C9_9CORY|nr:IS3 family transposase [Corynebacterium propinquum]MDK4300588.1 IS3 family transposase [Corynebacterium propinquum]